MQALSAALNRLLESGAWFTRAREIRLWTVHVRPDIRKAALKVLAGLEFHHDNRSAWIALADAHTKADRGWQVRANRLREHWEERRAACRKDGMELPALPALHESAAAATDPLAPFREALCDVQRGLAAPLEGLVIVLAPALVEDVEALCRELSPLLADDVLARCRWVLVLDDDRDTPALVERMESAAMASVCVPDPTQERRDLEAVLQPSRPGLGRAAPRGVTPPPRPHAPPAPSAEARAAALAAAGIHPDYPARAPDLQRLIFGAALAMKDGNGADALRQQREAAELALSLRLYDVAVICRIALATYLGALKQPDEALLELRESIEMSREHGLALQESQAHLGVGVLLGIAKRPAESGQAYRNAALAAEQAKLPGLALEAWRMCGQMYVEANEIEGACDGFQAAIRLAEDSPADAVQTSTVSEAARRLAEILDRQGMRAQADSLRTQALAMCRGEVGVATPDAGVN